MKRTTTEPAGPGAAWLLEERGRATSLAQLAASFSEHGVGRAAIGGLRKLLPSAWAAFDEELVNTVAQLIDVDMSESLHDCWCQHSAIVGALGRTADDPDSREIVTLADHVISSRYNPSIDILVDEVLVKTLVFDLAVDYDMKGISAVVAAGDLTGFRGGSCEAEATLSLGDVVLRSWGLRPSLERVLRVPRATEPAELVPAQRSSLRPVSA